MTTSQRTVSILIGVIGSIGSAFAMVGFLLKIRSNELPIPDVLNAQSFYQSAGASYTGGFVAGFSLCFFLTLLAVAVGTWFESRRDGAARRTEPVQIPLVEEGP